MFFIDLKFETFISLSEIFILKDCSNLILNLKIVSIS